MEKEKQEQSGGAICGGVVSQSTFDSDPWAYMMAFYMPDEKYNEYITIKDKKLQSSFFKEYARSAI